jgi:hypothetical protein
MGPALFPGIFSGGPCFPSGPICAKFTFAQCAAQGNRGRGAGTSLPLAIFFGGRPFRRFEERDGCAALISIAQQDRAFAALAAFEPGLTDEPPRRIVPT